MKAITLSIAIFSAIIFGSCGEKAKNGTDSTSGQDTVTEASPDTLQRIASITDIRWKLTEVVGKSVAQYPAQNKEPYLLFKADGIVEGTGGCNGMSGTYEIMEGGKIKFSPMIATKMACSDMTLESDFTRALEYTDSYSSDGQTLILSREGMPPLAKFSAGQ